MLPSICDQLRAIGRSKVEISAERGVGAEIILRWGESVGTVDGAKDLDNGAISFSSEISNVQMRGVGIDPVPCLLLSKVTDSTSQHLQDFRRKTDVGRILGIVICLNPDAFQYVVTKRYLPQDCSVILSCDDLRNMLAATDPLQTLKHFMRCQIPLKLLTPFSTSDSAVGNMFIGRKAELESLAYENQDFALCGPGGMGKTSLLRQVHWLRKQKRHPRADRFVFVDLLNCPRNLDAAAREIAKSIFDSRVANDADLASLDVTLRRLKYQDSRFRDGPIDLVLDEVGALLLFDRDQYDETGRNYQLMRKLKHARNMDVIRLTISARTETESLLNDSNNPFVPDPNGGTCGMSRLRLLKLTGLSDQECTSLLINPLRDLGYPVEVENSNLQKRLKSCHGAPDRIQGLGLNLVDEFCKLQSA